MRLIKSFCPVKLTREFGLGHIPAVLSTSAHPAPELRGFCSWLRCNSASSAAALKASHVFRARCAGIHGVGANTTRDLWKRERWEDLEPAGRTNPPRSCPSLWHFTARSSTTRDLRKAPGCVPGAASFPFHQVSLLEICSPRCPHPSCPSVSALKPLASCWRTQIPCLLVPVGHRGIGIASSWFQASQQDAAVSKTRAQPLHFRDKLLPRFTQ